MTIKQTHDRVEMLLKKSQTGSMNHGQIDIALSMGQSDLFAEYVSMIREKQFVHDALNPFRETKVFTQADFLSVGVLGCPADLEVVTGCDVFIFSNASGKNDYKPLTVVKDDEVGEMMRSELCPVDANNPICYQSGRNGVFTLNVLPSAYYNGTMRYLRVPQIPIFNFTTVGRQQVYNPTGSLPLEWSDTYCNSVIYKALGYLGVNLNAPAVVQFAKQTEAAKINQTVNMQ